MNKLKELRLKNNISQKDLAKKLGIEYQSYNKYELDKNQPSIETLKIIADYYNISLDYLCDRRYNNNVGYIPDERKETIKVLTNLDDNLFEKAKIYINALSDSKNWH